MIFREGIATAEGRQVSAAPLNSAGIWAGEAVSAITGTILFSTANLIIDIQKTTKKWKL